MANTSNNKENQFSLRDFHDVDRMNFMYSAFPHDRNINPRHWDSKMNYWIEEIRRCCMFSRDVCISCEMLRERFSMADGRVPNGLSIVICQMEKQGLLVNKEYLLRSIGDDWIGWTYSVVKGSARWLWSAFSGRNVAPEHKEYVFYDSLNVLGMELLKRHFEHIKCDKTDHVVPWNVVKAYYMNSKPGIGDEELMLILAHLKSKRNVELATNSKGEKLVKFAFSLETAVEKVNENDWNILRLKKAIAKLKIQTFDEKKEISKLESKAMSCLKEDDKMQAKRLIFQKKKLEKSLNLKEDTLLTLTSQIATIQNAASNRMIVDAINSSSCAVNASLEENELSPEMIDAVFEKNSEVSEYAKEIDDAISQGCLQSDSEIQELEQELSKLLCNDDFEGKEDSEENLTLPEVPDSSTIIYAEKKDSKNRIRALAK